MRQYSATATFTRPSDTTAYTSGDLVANSTTAASVSPMSFPVPIPGVSLERVEVTLSDATNTNAKFRLHLYSTSPTAATSHGDNASWSSTSAGWLGDVDIDCTVNAFTDKVTGIGYVNSADTPISLGSGTVYGLLAATASYTPISAETFTVTLFGKVD